jgi:hypothetical protein
MAVDHVKSTPITNLDAAPPTANTAGEGAAGHLLGRSAATRHRRGGVSINTTYQLVRIPSNAR